MVTYRKWLPYWTAEVDNISIITESAIAQHLSREKGKKRKKKRGVDRPWAPPTIRSQKVENQAVKETKEEMDLVER